MCGTILKMNNFNNFGLPVNNNPFINPQNGVGLGNTGYFAPTKPMDYDGYFGSQTKKPSFWDQTKMFFSQYGTKIFGWGATILGGLGAFALGKKFIDLDVPYGKDEQKPSEDASLMAKAKYHLCTFLSDTVGVMKPYERPVNNTVSIEDTKEDNESSSDDTIQQTPTTKKATKNKTPKRKTQHNTSTASSSSNSEIKKNNVHKPNETLLSKLGKKFKLVFRISTSTNGVESPSNSTSYQIEGKGEPMNSEEVCINFDSRIEKEPIFINDQGKNDGLYVPVKGLELLKRQKLSKKIPRFIDSNENQVYAKLDEKVFELKESNFKALIQLLSNKNVVQALLKQKSADDYDSSIIGKFAHNLLLRLSRQTAETQSDDISIRSSLELFNILKSTISTIPKTKDYTLLKETNKILDVINASEDLKNTYIFNTIQNIILDPTDISSYQQLSKYVANKVNYNDVIYLNHKGEQVKKDDPNAIFEISNNQGINITNLINKNKLTNGRFLKNNKMTDTQKAQSLAYKMIHYQTAPSRNLNVAISLIKESSDKKQTANDLITTLSKIDDFNFETFINSFVENDYNTSEENKVALDLLSLMKFNNINVKENIIATLQFKTNLYSSDFNFVETILNIKNMSLNIDDSQLASIINSCDLSNVDFKKIKEQATNLSYDDCNRVLNVLDTIDINKPISKDKTKTIHDLFYSIDNIKKLSMPINELKDLSTQDINYIITSTPYELKNTLKYKEFCKNVNTLYTNRITQTIDTNTQVNSMLEFASLFSNDETQINNFVKNLNKLETCDFTFSTDVINNLCETAKSTKEPNNSVNARFLLTSILNNNDINLNEENKMAMQEALITNFAQNVADTINDYNPNPPYQMIAQEISKFINTPIFTEDKNAQMHLKLLVQELYKNKCIQFDKLLIEIPKANTNNNPDQMIKLLYMITEVTSEDKDSNDDIPRTAYNTLITSITNTLDAIDSDNTTKQEKQIATISKYFNYIIENNQEVDNNNIPISNETKMSNLCQSIIPHLLKKNIITQNFVDTLMNNVLKSEIGDKEQPNLNMSLLNAIKETENCKEANEMAEVALNVIRITNQMQKAVSQEDEVISTIKDLLQKNSFNTNFAAKIFDKIEMRGLIFDELSKLITSSKDNIDAILPVFKNMNPNKQIGNKTVGEFVNNLYNNYIDSLMNQALNDDDNETDAIKKLQELTKTSKGDIKEMAEVALAVIKTQKDINSAPSLYEYDTPEFLFLQYIINYNDTLEKLASIVSKLNLEKLNINNMFSLLSSDNINENLLPLLYTMENKNQKIGEQTVDNLVAVAKKEAVKKAAEEAKKAEEEAAKKAAKEAAKKAAEEAAKKAAEEAAAEVNTLMEQALNDDNKTEAINKLQKLAKNSKGDIKEMAEVALNVIRITNQMQRAVSQEEEVISTIKDLLQKNSFNTNFAAKIFDKIEMRGLIFDELSKLITSSKDNIDAILPVLQNMNPNKQIGNKTVDELINYIQVSNNDVPDIGSNDSSKHTNDFMDYLTKFQYDDDANLKELVSKLNDLYNPLNEEEFTNICLAIFDKFKNNSKFFNEFVTTLYKKEIQADGSHKMIFENLYQVFSNLDNKIKSFNLNLSDEQLATLSYVQFEITLQKINQSKDKIQNEVEFTNATNKLFLGEGKNENFYNILFTMLEGNPNFIKHIADIIDIANISNMQNTEFFTQYQTINHLLKIYKYEIIDNLQMQEGVKKIIDDKLLRNTQTLEFYKNFSARENNKDLAREIASKLNKINGITRKIKAYKRLDKGISELEQDLDMKQNEFNSMLKENHLFHNYNSLGEDFISIINLFNT